MPKERSPRPRGVWSVEEADVPCPERVVLDTSFVVEALLPSEPLHQSCQRYLVRLADADTGIFYSRHLELELTETLFQLALKERHPKDWKRFRHDGRARARAARLMEGLTAWREVTAAVASRCGEVEAIAVLVPDLMSRYGLASYDAAHAATATATGVRRIVATDAGYARLPEAELSIYTGSTRVSLCRRMRP